MKVIGETNDGYIFEASKDEVQNLIGYYSRYQSGVVIRVGDHIKVSAMYQQLYNLSLLANQADQAKKTLTAAIELFSIVDPVVRQITNGVDGQP